MRTRVATMIAMIALAAPGVATAQPTATAAKACSHDVSAVIDGEHKCLGAGEYCKIQAEHQYEHYGFVCSTHYSPPRLRRK